MSKLGKFVQTSNDDLLYNIDYSQWLLSGETITSVDFEVETVTVPALATHDSSVIQTTGPAGQLPGTMVAFYVNGGLTANVYTITVTINTSNLQVKEDYILFSVQDPP